MTKFGRRGSIVAVLMVLIGPGGKAHEPALGSRPASDVREALVRRGATLPRALMRRALPMRAQTPAGVEPRSGAVARVTARGRLERLVMKSGGGERWEPIDARSQTRRPPGPGVDDPDNAGPGGTQSELSIAVDSTGQHIVVGMNDFRGFSADPVSVSGFAYSDDGGITFVDGGQLPVTTDTTSRFGQTWPQIFGDAEVKYLGGSNFVFFSLMVKPYGAGGLVQTLCFHRSGDNGHTWTGPYEIPVATNPNGGVDADGFALDAADKELADVDPDTGRVLVSWSNFSPVPPGGVEISTTFSDDLATAATPTWAPRRVIAAAADDGQAAVPRFAGNGSANAYMTWTRYTGYYTRNIGFSRSTDNGQTWSAPVNLSSTFVGMDYVLGNDRVNEFPSLAVDRTAGPFSGYVYNVYSNNNTLDGADIYFRRSSDGGATFSAPVIINSRPGADRAQWFPHVTVDTTTGRVYVFYYDQGSAASGDLTEVSCQFSDDGGTTWRKPAPLTDRPFHAGYGNDTGQPNLGDYNQAFSRGNELFVVFAANPNIVAFTDGQPSTQMTVPDVVFRRGPAERASLRLGAVSTTDSGGNGFADAGEQVQLTMPLLNYATNPLFASPVGGITGTLATATPNVTVTQATSAYPMAAPGATVGNATPFALQLGAGFVPGTRIELTLTVSTSEGITRLMHTLPTGTPLATTLLAENFDSVAPGTLPAGWSAVHGAGANTVPWTTSATFNAGNNGAFHPNAEDGGTGSPARWERLVSPSFTVPANSDYVVVEFDAKYDLENDPNLRVLAYDGMFLRITDTTTGRTLRSVLAEAFAEEFTTGSLQHYPRHLPRSGDPSYFEDMSAWSGDSQGLQHVRLKLPGMAASRAQLRFEFTQDSNTTCADVRPGHTCGVLIDNVVVSSVVAGQADLSIAKSGPSTVVSGSNMTYTLVATNNGTDPARNTAANALVSDPLPAGTTFVSAATPAGWTCSSPSAGSGGTVSCSKPSMAPGETATFSVVVNIGCATADGTSLANTATIASSTSDPNAANNSSSLTTAVSNPPPQISGVSATPPELGPPNHKLVDVTVHYTATENCGAVTTALSVASNEAVNGNGDGNTSPDWIVVDEHHVRLRAERSGSGTGRVYTIAITATNAQGISSTRQVEVRVPLNRSR